MPEKPAPTSWPLPASQWPTALSLPKGVAGQPVAETEQGIRRIGPAPVMGLGLALRLRPCSAAAAVNSRPSSGTPTSRSVTGRRSSRHSLPTASAAASPASSPVIPLSDKPVASANQALPSGAGIQVERLDPCRFKPTSLSSCRTTSAQTLFGYRYRPMSGQTSPGQRPPRLTAASGA